MQKNKDAEKRKEVYEFIRSKGFDLSQPERKMISRILKKMEKPKKHKIEKEFLSFTKNQIKKLKNELADYMDNEKLFRTFMNKFLRQYKKKTKEHFNIDVEVR
jgi:hypothetical protein